MTKYVYRYYDDVGWHDGSIEADNLTDFRRKAIKRHGKSLLIREVEIPQGFDKGSVPKDTGLWGFQYRRTDDRYWAKYRVNEETRMRPVSPKTGKYLDVNKYRKWI